MTDARVTHDPRAVAPEPPMDPTQPIEPDRSLGELLSRLSTDFGELVSTQVELAKVEIKEEVSRAAKGTGLLGGGAVAAHMALLLLSFAAAWGLAEVMAAGLAFLIMGVIWAIAAAVLAMQGRKKLRTATPVIPQTKEELKEDVEWAKQQTT
jgi:uncharacterized membrane protein YqjE